MSAVDPTTGCCGSVPLIVWTRPMGREPCTACCDNLFSSALSSAAKASPWTTRGAATLRRVLHAKRELPDEPAVLTFKESSENDLPDCDAEDITATMAFCEPPAMLPLLISGPLLWRYPTGPPVICGCDVARGGSGPLSDCGEPAPPPPPHPASTAAAQRAMTVPSADVADFTDSVSSARLDRSGRFTEIKQRV